jgi:hypothetical protein
LQQIAELEAPTAKVVLWPKIHDALSQHHNQSANAFHPRGVQFVLGLGACLLIAVSAFFFVPSVRAAVDRVVQRMGIAFADTSQCGPNAQVSQAEPMLLAVTPPPSLSLEEVQAQISFPLLVPAWLPQGLNTVYRSVSRVSDLQTRQGVTFQIEYYRMPALNPEKGRLLLAAGTGSTGATPLLAEMTETRVTVNGNSGYYVHGGWQNDGRGNPRIRIGSLLWDDQVDAAYLTWVQDGVTYLLEAENLGLGSEDLLRVAQSLQRP